MTRTCLAACGLLTLAGVAPAAPAMIAPVVQEQSLGVAVATVLHVATRQPLANVPVFVEADIPPDGGGSPMVFMTGKDGRAVIGPLETGDYIAYVSYNNHISNVVQFHINGDTDMVVMFTLLFNPDIDG